MTVIGAAVLIKYQMVVVGVVIAAILGCVLVVDGMRNADITPEKLNQYSAQNRRAKKR